MTNKTEDLKTITQKMLIACRFVLESLRADQLDSGVATHWKLEISALEETLKQENVDAIYNWRT